MSARVAGTRACNLTMPTCTGHIHPSVFGHRDGSLGCESHLCPPAYARIGTQSSGCGSRGPFSRPLLYACSPSSPRVFQCLLSLHDDLELECRSPCQSKGCGDRVAVNEVCRDTYFVSANVFVEKNVQIPASWLNLCDNTFFNRSRMTLKVASGFRRSSTLCK